MHTAITSFWKLSRLGRQKINGDQPVCNAKLLAKVQGKNQLLEKSPGHILLQSLPGPRALVLDDILKHVTARCKLHDNCEVLGRQKHLLELDDVWVGNAQTMI